MAAEDVLTAVADLHAKPLQARLVSANAFAWRAAVVTLPVAVAVGLVLVVAQRLALGEAAGTALAAFFVPHIVALVITIVFGFLPDLLTLFCGTHEQRVRFAIGGGNAYCYYGWRYAFRRRQRPWGALTHDEKLAQNPRRVGVPPSNG